VPHCIVGRQINRVSVNIQPGHLFTVLSFSPPQLSTKTERRVNIHPKSVNANERFFTSPWFVYHLKLKTSQVCFHTTLSSVTSTTFGWGTVYCFQYNLFVNTPTLKSYDRFLMTFGGNIGCEWTIEESSKFWKDMVGLVL